MTGVPILANVTTGVRLAVEVAWGADLTNLTGSTWTWSDVTSDVQLSGGWGVDIQIGRADESTETQASQLTVLLDNTSGAYSLGGQASNYPNVVIGTPVRVRVSTNSGTSWTVKYQGNAVGFTPNWDTTGKWATVTLIASGPLRQLNQGTLPLTSALTTYIESGAESNVVAYWPIEDGVNAASIAAGTAATPTGVIFGGAGGSFASQLAADSTTFPCAAPLPVGTELALTIPTYTGPFQSTWLIKTPTTGISFSSPVVAEFANILYPAAGTVKAWALIMYGQGGVGNNGAISVDAYNSTTLGSATHIAGTGTFNFGFDGVPTVICISLAASGSNTLVSMTTQDIATGDNTAIINHSVAAAYSRIGSMVFVDVNGVTGGQLLIQNAASGISSGLSEAAYANSEESVTDRLTRLCAQAAIPLVILTDTGGETSTNPADKMGPQYYDTATALLRECEASGLGLLFDGVNIGLTYLTRDRRMSQQPSITLSATSGVIVMPFAPIYDDQGLVNQAQATRRNGSTYTYNNTTSISQIGVYSASVQTNQFDDSGLPAMAQWLASVGTPVGGYRYPTFTFALEKAPSLITSWLTCTPGARLDVTNLSSVRSQHPTGTIRNVLEGWHEQISQHEWNVTANTSSYEPWKVATLAAPTGTTVDTVGRYESDGSTVTTSVSAGATSLSVTTASGPKWTTSSVTADDFPLTVAINGYPITVTAISSTTSPQTFTVSAVPKAIASGSAVTIYQNAVLGV